MEEGTKEEELQRKKAVLKAIVGICFSVLGFIALFAGAFMQAGGVPDRIIIPVILSGFFGCNLVGLVFLFKAAPDIMLSDMMKTISARNKVYEESGLSEIPEMKKEGVTDRLAQNRFRRTQEGYFVKKKFSLYKDFIYYYVCLVEDIGIENAVSRELARFEQMKKKGNAFCLILLIWLDKISEKEKNELKEESKNSLLYEYAYEYVFRQGTSLIVVAIDESTHTGYYLKMPEKTVPFLYRRGCGLIEEVFAGDRNFAKE